jgi:hypothetical protein
MMNRRRLRTVPRLQSGKLFTSILKYAIIRVTLVPSQNRQQRSTKCQ